MIPGANAHVYYNEEGEPIGWDYPEYDDEFTYENFYEDYDEDDDYR